MTRRSDASEGASAMTSRIFLAFSASLVKSSSGEAVGWWRCCVVVVVCVGWLCGGSSRHHTRGGNKSALYSHAACADGVCYVCSS
jgi:hypothetical protein